MFYVVACIWFYMLLNQHEIGLTKFYAKILQILSVNKSISRFMPQAFYKNKAKTTLTLPLPPQHIYDLFIQAGFDSSYH